MLGDAQTFIGVLVTLVVLCLFREESGNFMRLIIRELRGDVERYLNEKVGAVQEKTKKILEPDEDKETETGYNIEYWLLQAQNTSFEGMLEMKWIALKSEITQTVNKIRLLEVFQQKKADAIDSKNGDRYVALYLLLWGIAVMFVDALADELSCMKSISGQFLMLSTILSTVFLYKLWLYAIDDREGGWKRISYLFPCSKVKLLVNNGNVLMDEVTVMEGANINSSDCKALSGKGKEHMRFFRRNGALFASFFTVILAGLLMAAFLDMWLYIALFFFLLYIAVYCWGIRKFKVLNMKNACSMGFVAKHGLLVIGFSLLLPMCMWMIESMDWFWNIDSVYIYKADWVVNVHAFDAVPCLIPVFVLIFTCNAFVLPFFIYYYEHRRWVRLVSDAVDIVVTERDRGIEEAKKEVRKVICQIQKSKVEESKQKR